MLVQLPASSQELGATKRGQIFIGLILIPVLTVVFAFRFALWLTPSFLRSERSYKRLDDVHHLHDDQTSIPLNKAELLQRGSENPLKAPLCPDGVHP